MAKLTRRLFILTSLMEGDILLSLIQGDLAHGVSQGVCSE
jgi:hypothetical protein